MKQIAASDTVLSPWVTLVARTVVSREGGIVRITDEYGRVEPLKEG